MRVVICNNMYVIWDKLSVIYGNRTRPYPHRMKVIPLYFKHLVAFVFHIACIILSYLDSNLSCISSISTYIYLKVATLIRKITQTILLLFSLRIK